MALTANQLASLRTYILAQSDLSGLTGTADGRFAIAQKLNLPASPEYTVWATTVKTDDLRSNSGFDWTRVDNLTVGKARIWAWITGLATVNAALANIRAGFAAAFSTAGDAATLTAILAVCKRPAKRAEAVLSVATVGGSGARGSPANPDTLTFEGSVSANDVEAALNS